MFFNSSMPSISMLLPRETMKPTSPHAIAAARDSPTSTRHATLPKGTTVHSQEYIAQNGYPGGCGMPA